MKKVYVLLFFIVALLFISGCADDSGQWEYTLYEGKAIITGSKNERLNGAIKIPNKVDGFEVGEIDSKAFKGNTNITSVIISEGIEGIGSEAFRGCNLLNSVIIPKSINWIQEDAFSDCAKLISITISEGAKQYPISHFIDVAV